MENFDYSVVPGGFGHCMASCPQAATCLRHIAYEHLPANKAFVRMLVPRIAEQAQGKCKYYCSNAKVRFAKGFARIIDELSVKQAAAFRERMIGKMGRKNYYASRKGDRLLPVSTAIPTALSGNKQRALLPSWHASVCFRRGNSVSSIRKRSLPLKGTTVTIERERLFPYRGTGVSSYRKRGKVTTFRVSKTICFQTNRNRQRYVPSSVSGCRLRISPMFSLNTYTAKLCRSFRP